MSFGFSAGPFEASQYPLLLLGRGGSGDVATGSAGRKP